MAEKLTKTSSPDWRWMNPKPLLALNHFTVPCSLTYLLTFLLSYLCFSTASSRKSKEAASVNLQPLQSNLKVLQEQQTQGQGTTLSPLRLIKFTRARLVEKPFHCPRAHALQKRQIGGFSCNSRRFSLSRTSS